MSDWDKMIDEPMEKVMGFRVGDIVRWSGFGQRMKIVAFLRKKQHEGIALEKFRWWACCEAVDDPSKRRNWGVAYLKKCDVIEQLASKAREEEG
jgi:hypothetical protein